MVHLKIYSFMRALLLLLVVVVAAVVVVVVVVLNLFAIVRG